MLEGKGVDLDKEGKVEWEEELKLFKIILPNSLFSKRENSVLSMISSLLDGMAINLFPLIRTIDFFMGLNEKCSIALILIISSQMGPFEFNRIGRVST